ncbi:ATP-binding protein [Balneola sp. MJW-20]|uniref:ATP-binding protein n=1 Tax=Gracilimonas aurantiaca TaxID=3234185 RepID=UPI003466F0A5
MKPEKERKLDEAFEGFIKRAFQEIPLDGVKDFVHEHIMGFGTTVGEEVFSADQFINYIEQQKEQGKDLEFRFQREPFYKRFLEEDDIALIAEHVHATVKTPDGNVVQLTFLMSNVLSWSGERWKVVHWHGSIPSDSENDVWHVNEWKAEKEKLEKLVAEQTAALKQKNRELEIESATERVRAQATGMQKSSDLLDIMVTMRKEFVDLGFEAHYFWHMRWLEDTYEKAMTSGDGSKIGMVMTLPRHIHGDIKQVADWEKSDEPTHVLAMDAETAVDYVDKMITLGDFERVDPQAPTLDDVRQIGGLTFVMARTTHGEIGYSLPGVVEEPPEEALQTLIRFAGAFDLAYRRFEDLKRAENQARKAQIEVSLERVRSRTSGMQRSEELGDVAVLIRKELRSLGFPELFESGYIEWKEEDGIQQGWMSDFEGRNMEPFQLPLNGDPVLNERYQGYKDQLSLLHQEVGGKKLADHIIFAMPSITSDNVRHQVDNYFSDPTHFYHSFFEDGALKVISQEKLTPEQEQLLVRFTKVFKQTFARFKDLKIAEKQAYESRVEASLERVRSMSAAMNHSDDLMQIAEFMFEEMEILQINPLRYGLAMIDNEEREAELWASTVNDGHYLDLLGRISLNWHPMLLKAFDAWDAQLEEMIYVLKGSERADYYERVTKINPNIPDVDQLTDPNSGIEQHCSFLPFKTGILYAFTSDEPSAEGLSILKRFANVFEQAYARFEDLQKTEKQARLIREERDRLEQTLKELHATQDQLIQQEKLASLGQLTAGIAHEIKNPLNFVNNFSDLSVELIDEVREEIESVQEIHDSPQMDEINAILDDIKANLQKINEHGTRADSIVKSMLQHSRGGAGSMEPTNVNNLVREYVNLAFHGMRAGKDPISLDIDLNLDESLTEVPMIAEDFSRVILNLCNNAFDALREKGKVKSETGEEFRPELSVSTSKSKTNIVIEISDNGPGIPEEIKDKILQPFFTTKKGTQGTGLGLSITNDIIKAHGGTLEIYANEPEGSRFSILIPEKATS